MKPHSVVVALLVIALLAALAFFARTGGEAAEARSEAAASEGLESGRVQAPARDAEPTTTGSVPTASDDEREVVGGREATPPEVDGMWIVGHVRAPVGVVPGADVRVGLTRGSVSEALGRTTTDEAGAYRVDVSDLLERSPTFVLGAEVWVLARAAGHGPSRAGLEGGELAPGENVIDVDLRAGAVLTGRVLQPDGAPAKGAWVALETDRSASGDGTRMSITTRRADDDGRFAFVLPRHRLVRFRGDLAGLGHVRRSLAGLDPSESIDLGDLVLRVDGVLEGLVACADGTPVPGVAVYASSDEAGVTGGRVFSDSHGGFRFAGLTGSSYLLRWGDEPASFGPIPVGTLDVSVQPASRFLRVTVVDEDGTPLPGAELECALSRAEPLEGRADTAFTSATADGPEAAATLRVDDFSTATLSTEVPGTDHDVFERVELSGSSCVREHRLVVRRDLPVGRIALVLRDEAGARLGEYSIALEPVSALEPTYDFDADDEDELGVLPPVLAGEYHVAVRPGDDRDPDNYLLEFELEGPVAVRAGEVLRVERRASSGGRLQIRATCSPAPSTSVEAIRVSWDPHRTGRGWTLSFRAVDSDPGRSSNRIAHDQPYVSRDSLRPGTFPFRIERPGYETVEMFVTLEPGRVTQVETLLLPKLR